jgi:hypothetical protein
MTITETHVTYFWLNLSYNNSVFALTGWANTGVVLIQRQSRHGIIQSNSSSCLVVLILTIWCHTLRTRAAPPGYSLRLEVLLQSSSYHINSTVLHLPPTFGTYSVDGHIPCSYTIRRLSTDMATDRTLFIKQSYTNSQNNASFSFTENSRVL